MAFPISSVLDSFNRANGAPGSNWTAPVGTGTIFTITSNQAVLANTKEGYWNPSTFGPDCEVFGTYVSLSTINGTGTLYLRLQTPGSAAVDGYSLQISPVVGSLTLARIDNNTSTTLGAVFSGLTISGGDKFGLSAVGSTLEVWLNHAGGGWVSQGTRTDSTYSGAGYIGVRSDQSFSNTITMDDFGGGTIGHSAPPSVDITIR